MAARNALSSLVIVPLFHVASKTCPAAGAVDGAFFVEPIASLSLDTSIASGLLHGEPHPITLILRGTMTSTWAHLGRLGQEYAA
jgi:hypothetical protein